ncbi:MAG: hypothetical protein HZA78_08980 [Candidatus Schekmanbacteria bacterium]|nr:hypothetical protein [Candidatus Schekmanbacteria bacterium]
MPIKLKYLFNLILLLPTFFVTNGYCQTASAKPQAKAEMTDIIDIKPLEEIGLNYKFWALFSGALLLAALLITLLVYFLRKRKKIAQEKLLNRPAHEVALEGMRQLQDQKIYGPEEIKRLYFELSEVFRTYLEKRYQFPATDWTTEEIVVLLGKNYQLSFDLKKQAKAFLTNTDLVKFAELVPAEDDIHDEIQRAIKIIEGTKEIPLEA